MIKNDTGITLNCNIHFVTAGENPIYTQLVDPNANEIPVTLVDTVYTIIPEFGNILILISMLSILAITILLFKKKALLRKHARALLAHTKRARQSITSIPTFLYARARIVEADSVISFKKLIR
jgi:uncharacterized membrane protein YozB (DUF420 family)